MVASASLSKILRMSFSPIENRYRRIIKVLVLLATFTRYRGAENAGRIKQDGEGKKGALRRDLGVN